MKRGPGGARGRAARRAMALLGGVAVFCGTALGQLAGCTGSLFQSKAVPPAVYLLSAQLEPPAAAAASAPAVVAADLAVQKPRVRAGLDTDRIAVLHQDRRLDYFAAARWSGPLDVVVQDLAAQAFRSGTRLRTVSADASAFASGYWLEIEIVDFQAEYAAAGGSVDAGAAAPPTVNVHLLARVGGAGDRQVLGSFDAGARQTATDNRLTAIVAAFERAADTALAQIVADTVRTLAIPQNSAKPVAAASR
jgi:cholesterol transport system auxiliary component